MSYDLEYLVNILEEILFKIKQYFQFHKKL